MAHAEMISWADALEPPRTIFLGLDHDRQVGVLVVVPTELLPEPGSLLQICGRFQEGQYATLIFSAEEVHALRP
jgi:hypothetical protein